METQTHGNRRADRPISFGALFSLFSAAMMALAVAYFCVSSRNPWPIGIAACTAVVFWNVQKVCTLYGSEADKSREMCFWVGAKHFMLASLTAFFVVFDGDPDRIFADAPMWPFALPTAVAVAFAWAKGRQMGGFDWKARYVGNGEYRLDNGKKTRCLANQVGNAPLILMLGVSVYMMLLSWPR